jgi:hypothetical protein
VKGDRSERQRIKSMSLLEGGIKVVKEHCMLKKQGGEHLAFRTLISFFTSTNGIEVLYSTTKKEVLFILHYLQIQTKKIL